jgi:hypothetical protein
MQPKNSHKQNRLRAKTRVNEPDSTVRIIVEATKKALAAVQQRCAESLKALDQQDHLVALGAIVGLDGQVRQIAARIMVLREIKEIQKTKS